MKLFFHNRQKIGCLCFFCCFSNLQYIEDLTESSLKSIWNHDIAELTFKLVRFIMFSSDIFEDSKWKISFLCACLMNYVTSRYIKLFMCFSVRYLQNRAIHIFASMVHQHNSLHQLSTESLSGFLLIIFVFSRWYYS